MSRYFILGTVARYFFLKSLTVSAYAVRVSAAFVPQTTARSFISRIMIASKHFIKTGLVAVLINCTCAFPIPRLSHSICTQSGLGMERHRRLFIRRKRWMNWNINALSVPIWDFPGGETLWFYFPLGAMSSPSTIQHCSNQMPRSDCFLGKI